MIDKDRDDELEFWKLSFHLLTTFVHLLDILAWETEARHMYPLLLRLPEKKVNTPQIYPENSP